MEAGPGSFTLVERAVIAPARGEGLDITGRKGLDALTGPTPKPIVWR